METGNDHNGGPSPARRDASGIDPEALERLIVESFARDRDTIPVATEGVTDRAVEVLTQRRAGFGTAPVRAGGLFSRALGALRRPRFSPVRLRVIGGAAAGIAVVVVAMIVPRQPEGAGAGAGVYDTAEAIYVVAGSVNVGSGGEEQFTGVSAQPLSSEMQPR